MKCTSVRKGKRESACLPCRLPACHAAVLIPAEPPTSVRVLALDARVKDCGGMLVKVKLEERARLALHRGSTVGGTASRATNPAWVVHGGQQPTYMVLPGKGYAMASDAAPRAGTPAGTAPPGGACTAPGVCTCALLMMRS